jgi:hypothetical protein
LIVGDFNSDFINRNKRFDKKFSKFLSENNIFDAAHSFGVSDQNTYFNGNYCAVLDHICGNSNTLHKLTSYTVINDVLDVSDHKPINCSIDLGQGHPRLENTSKRRKVHKFPWKKTIFIELYSIELNKLLRNLMAECSNESLVLNDEYFINLIHDQIPKLMLRSARAAEKQLGTFTRNGLMRGNVTRCCNSSRISTLLLELKHARHNGIGNGDDSVRIRKRELMALQRLSI